MLLTRTLLAVLLAGTALPALAAATDTTSVQTVIVTASRVNLIGRATTASQGSVTRKEIELRPVYRVGQILESVPSLVVTVHSGEGKANQYLIRGYNLDHGTDLATFVDDMPVNRPTNAHGQGYTDLNFLIPELANGIDYTKGPYFASVGDFGAVASDHVSLIDDLPTQIQATTGTKGYDDLFVGGTYHFANGIRLLNALDIGRIDGPWTHPENYRRIDATTRLSQGTNANGWTLTGMYYKGQGRNDTDQPARAIAEGLIGTYGSLDPTDGNKSDRWSVSGHYGTTGVNWKLSANTYLIHSSMVLWNDFTHLLFDPVNGDQEQQDETRTTLGEDVAYTYYKSFSEIESDTTVGIQDRYDTEYIDRRHTKDRVVLDYCNDGNGNYSVGEYACTADLVQLNDVAPYIENTTHWTPLVRTILGVREDYDSGNIRSVLASFPFNGHAGEFLLQPKASIAIGPFYGTEFYYSAGKGFHSDDLRGVLGSVPLEGTPYAVGQVPLMAKTFGQEIGIRNATWRKLQTQITVFRQDFSSEQMYDQDAGQDQATAPSRRTGVEASVEYRPYNWIELNTDVDFTKARYFGSASKLAGFPFYITGGAYIANAPKYTASFGILIDNLGNWYGGLVERILGPQPLTDGPFFPSTRGYAEANLDVGYRFTPKLKAQFSVYNLFNSHADSAEYYYATDITQAEVAKYGTTGVSDYQVHPLEPISVRATVTYLF